MSNDTDSSISFIQVMSTTSVMTPTYNTAAATNKYTVTTTVCRNTENIQSKAYNMTFAWHYIAHCAVQPPLIQVIL